MGKLRRIFQVNWFRRKKGVSLKNNEEHSNQRAKKILEENVSSSLE